MLFNIDTFAFLYGDYEYFQWFKNKTKPNLKSVIKWKGLQRTRLYEKTKNRLKEGKIVSNGKFFESFKPVTRAFLHHLNDPKGYPILDINVFNAMIDLKPEYRNETTKTMCNWVKDYEKGYKLFFEDLYRNNKNAIKAPHLDGIELEIIKRRILDRALWEYGKILKLSKQNDC
ncbi:MAG: hypothetical protein ACETWQ_07735 [Phycisphaerae bacterium]